MPPDFNTTFETHATVVAYDVHPVIETLDSDLVEHSALFLDHVLHHFGYHTVEGFDPHALGALANRFNEQHTAIGHFYRLLQTPIRRIGDHAVTRCHQGTLWVAYLDHYYR